MKFRWSIVSVLFALFFISAYLIFFKKDLPDFITYYYEPPITTEIITQFKIIADSFLEVKSMKGPIADNSSQLTEVSGADNHKPEYSWILLNEISRKYGIVIKVYDNSGRQVIYPGKYIENDDPAVMTLLYSNDETDDIKITGDRIFYKYSVTVQDRCMICHPSFKNNNSAGVFTFEKKIDSDYYKVFKIYVFVVISIFTIFTMIIIIMYNPKKYPASFFSRD